MTNINFINKLLREQEFVKIENAYCPSSISKLKTKLDSFEKLVTDNSHKHDLTDRWYLKHRIDDGVLYDLYQRLPVVRSICDDPILQDILANFFQSPYYLYVNSYLFKPGDRDNVVPWHQDFLSRPNQSEKVIAWVSIDQTGPLNGELRVIPGSHRSGFRPMKVEPDKTHHTSVALNNDEKNDILDLETKPVDVNLFSNFLVHSSTQNSTGKPRRALRFASKSLDDASLPRGSILMMGVDHNTYVSAPEKIKISKLLN